MAVGAAHHCALVAPYTALGRRSDGAQRAHDPHWNMGNLLVALLMFPLGYVKGNNFFETKPGHLPDASLERDGDLLRGNSCRKVQYSLSLTIHLAYVSHQASEISRRAYIDQGHLTQ